MTGFVAEIDNDAAAAADEAAAGGNGGFPPLPAGKYQATVVKIKGVADFGGNGGNAKKKVLEIQLRILDNSPNGAKRVFFDRIPLFTRYAPNEKNPQGATARTFWDFFGKAIGWSRDLLLSNQLPGVNDIQGKQVTVTLSAPKAPDGYNPLGFNEVSFYDAAGDLSSTPLGRAVAPWLDEAGNLIGGTPAPAAPQQQAAAAQSAPPAWSGAQATEQSAPPAWTPNPQGVAYAQQATDPALAAAAAAGKGY